MTPLDDWLTTLEAAELAGYHQEYMRKLVKSGEIEARKWGNSWMISKKSLLQYISNMEGQGEKRGPKHGKRG
jgi:excisionase family DNA binding protein